MSRTALPDALLEAIRYEHWLRFYFMELPEDTERGGGLTATLRVPSAVAEASRRAEPHLSPLLDELQGREISLDGARDAVFGFVARAEGGEPTDSAFGERLFHLVGDPDFRRGLDAFHAWVQELANGETRLREGEDARDEEKGEQAPSFAQWEAAFRAWEGEEAVRHVTRIGSFADKETR